MQRLRISATDLDGFRRYLADEEMTLADFLARFRREAPATDRMRAGTALHTALETISDGDFDTLAADGFTFDFSGVTENLALPKIREVRAFEDRVVNGVPITLTGQVDAVYGRAITDHKLTGRLDFDRFLSSYQWRVYLDLFDADRFTWVIYDADEDRDDPRRYRIKAVHRLTAHRYPGMADDVSQLLAQFVETVKPHIEVAT